jgi:diguanylate cyclase (GGDEF)-like protein
MQRYTEPAGRTPWIRPFDGVSDSIPSPDRLQHSIVFYSSMMVLVTMTITISSLAWLGKYDVDFGAVVDVFTILAVGGAAVLAFKRKRTLMQGLLLCISLPVNLIAMLIMDQQGLFVGLLLLSITPIIWGLFTTMWCSVLYTTLIVGFINWYMGPAARVELVVNGTEDTLLSAIVLSLITVACCVAAVLPKQLGRNVYETLREMVQRQNRQKSRSTSFAELSSDWHLEVDSTGKIIHYFGKGDALGRQWREVLIGWESEEASFTQAIRNREPFSRIKGVLRADGVNCRVEFSGRPQFCEKGNFLGYYGIAHDISLREKFEQKLKQQATTDLLTGLENRHAFNALVETCRTESGTAPLSILYIDLDKFKELNDRHGHSGGDTALIELGERLKRLANEDDDVRVFRIGGDEFCCVLNRLAELPELSLLAGRIRALMTEPISYDGRLIDLTASIGAAIRKPGEGIEDVLEQADAAVYEAKSQGGDSCVVPDKDVRERLERRVSIHRELISAIENGEIGLHYQPIVRVSDCQLVGVEALARWSHPKYGQISPSEFIEIAEASRHIIAFGQYVLHKACEDTLGWMSTSGDEIRLSVNVSPNELLSHGFAQSVADTLSATGFPPRLLELEITERGVLKNIEASCEVIENIRQTGVTIALDDFGTGNSSLSRLEHLPVDRVKIDRSFFVRAEESDRARQVLGILSGMSRVLNINVVAEGVETEEQFRFVNLAGFSEVQGYLFGKPTPIGDLPGRLSSSFGAGLSA